VHGEPGIPLRDKGDRISLYSGRDQRSGSIQGPLAQVAAAVVIVADRLLPEGLEQLDPTLHVYRSPGNIGTSFCGSSEDFDEHPARRRWRGRQREAGAQNLDRARNLNSRPFMVAGYFNLKGTGDNKSSLPKKSFIPN